MAPPGGESTSELERRLALTPLGGPDRGPEAVGFRGLPHANDVSHVFGGLVVAQALLAAHRTVTGGLWAHSLHASFLRTPRPDEPLDHEVERTRDGSSFATRRVVVRQAAAAPVALLTASFHGAEDGAEYQPALRFDDPIGPEGLPAGRYDGPVFDCRDVPVAGAGGAPERGDRSGANPAVEPRHVRRMWFRARGGLTDDPVLHLCGLAMAADGGPTRAVREPHAHLPGVEARRSVSLDHSVWFHRRGRVDAWCLLELTPMSTGGGRGLATGSVWTADGVLLATVAQEALLRIPGAAG